MMATDSRAIPTYGARHGGCQSCYVPRRWQLAGFQVVVVLTGTDSEVEAAKLVIIVAVAAVSQQVLKETEV